MFILFEKETDKRAIVTYQHSNPEILSKDQLKQGLLVDTIPEPITQEGKYSKLFINPETKELWYEYYEAPVNELTALENKIEIQNQKLEEQEKAIMELTQLLAGGVA